MDKNLKPNKTFLYKVKITDKENDTISTQQINAKTIDTTSHNFKYTIWEFGELSSSILYDVAIIDDINIWAVGDINTQNQSYNAVYWDGDNWNLIRILYKDAFWEINVINEVDEKNIWVEAFIHWNGKDFLELPIQTALQGFNILGMWGNSNENLIVIGDNGNVVTYDGSEWINIENVTDLTLTDIYGTSDNEVYVSGTNTSTVQGIILKKDKLGNWGTFIESGVVNENELFTKLYGELDAIWIDERNTNILVEIYYTGIKIINGIMLLRFRRIQ